MWGPNFGLAIHRRQKVTVSQKRRLVSPARKVLHLPFATPNQRMWSWLDHTRWQRSSSMCAVRTTFFFFFFFQNCWGGDRGGEAAPHPPCSASLDVVKRYAPRYISDLFRKKSSPWSSLRLNDLTLLVVPWTKWKTLCDRAFAYAGPWMENMLLKPIQMAQNLNFFFSKKN